MSEAAPTTTPTTPAPGTNGAAADATKPAPGPTKPTTDVAKPPEKRSFKLKVDGKEEAWEGTDEEIAHELQKVRASTRRFEEARKAKQEAQSERESFAKKLKENPRAALKEAGIDVEDWMAKELAEEIRSGQMTPEQRELQKLKAQLSETEKQQKQRETQEAAAKMSAAADAQWKALEPQFVKAMEAHADLPRTKGTMARIAEVGLEFLNAGLDLTPAQVVAEVARREADGFTGRIRKAPVEALEKLLTPEQVKGLAKREAERIRKARNGGDLNPDTSTTAPEPAKRKPRTEEPQWISPGEFMKASRLKRNK